MLFSLTGWAKMNTNWKLVSWNVCELNRKAVVRNWLRSYKQEFNFLALQEIKAEKFILGLALRTILPSFLHFSSDTVDGKGGTVLLVKPTLKGIETGVLSLGRAVWV